MFKKVIFTLLFMGNLFTQFNNYLGASTKYNGSSVSIGSWYDTSPIIRTIQEWYYGNYVKDNWCATSVSYFANEENILYQLGGKSENVYEMYLKCSGYAQSHTDVKFMNYRNLQGIVPQGSLVFINWGGAGSTFTTTSQKHVAVTSKNLLGTSDSFNCIGGNQSIDTYYQDGVKTGGKVGITTSLINRKYVEAIYIPKYETSYQTSYYGHTDDEWFDTMIPFESEENNANAKYIYDQLSSRGWSFNAICAILGNMQHESSLNPTKYKNDSDNVLGIVQWTPKSKLIDWADNEGLNYYNMNTQLARIQYEADTANEQWNPYRQRETFKEFTEDTVHDIEWLTYEFFHVYEQPDDDSFEQRLYYANYYADLLLGRPIPPYVPDPVDPEYPEDTPTPPTEVKKFTKMIYTLRPYWKRYYNI